MRPNISLITLGVNDFAKSLVFYRDGLKLPEPSMPSDDVAFFPLHGIILALYPKDLLAKDATVSAEGSGFGGIALAFNAKSEAEVDEVLKEAEKAGGKIVKPGQKVFWGGYNGYFSDLDGYLWEVAFNPGWELDQEGKVILG